VQSNAIILAARVQSLRVSKAMRSLTLALLGGLLLAAAAQAEPFATCLPPWNQAPIGGRPPPSSALPFNVLIDATKSMAGFYTQPSSETDDFNAARFYAVMDDAAAAVSSRPRYYKFGSEVSTAPLTQKEVAAVDTPQFYFGSDSNVTALDKAIAFAARQPRRSLTVIVSDLFETDDLRKVRETRMSVKLRDAIRAGNTIGIWGATALFRGAAYDIPGPVHTYKGARLRPIFLLMIGDDQRMRMFQSELGELLGKGLATEEIYAPRPLWENAGELQIDTAGTLAVQQAYDLASRSLRVTQLRAREGSGIDLKMGGDAQTGEAAGADMAAQLSVWRLLPGDDSCAWASIPAGKNPDVKHNGRNIRVSLAETRGVFEQRAVFAIQVDLVAKPPAQGADFSKLSADDAAVAAAVRLNRPFLPARNLAPLIERIKSETAGTSAPTVVARAHFLVRWDPH
jgi:hypothetical protein